MLVWGVPGGASGRFLISVIPRISLVGVCSFMLHNGVLPWVLVDLTVFVAVTKMGSIRTVTRSIGESLGSGSGGSRSKKGKSVVVHSFFSRILLRLAFKVMLL